ncbi:MAG: endonuclease/exonuclease/phosphatase family protein [Pseudomonadota bacterium]
MRLATYNVEWFNALFDDDGALLHDNGWSARWDVTRAMQLDALTEVFNALDADGIVVIEAPDSSRNRNGRRALETFAAHAGLRAREAVIGFQNDTQQEILFLYDPDVLTPRHAPGSSPNAPRFDQSFAIDLDVDSAPEEVVFSKPPLELWLEGPNGFATHLIGVHAKSKAPHGAKDDTDAVRLKIANRRKQLAQCIWIRRRVDALLNDDASQMASDDLIVMGDFNDGPGLDQFEELFGRSGVEIVLGQGKNALFDPHAAQALSQRLGAAPTTARFYLRHEERYLQALLDYAMVSSSIRARGPKWRILHPFDDKACWDQRGLRDALLTASDHFPVVLDIPLSP